MKPGWMMAVACLVAVGLLLWLLQHLVFKRWAKEMLEEFMQTFPGVCPICSFHTYQIMSMHDVDLQAPPHDCYGLRSVTIFGKKGE